MPLADHIQRSHPSHGVNTDIHFYGDGSGPTFRIMDGTSKEGGWNERLKARGVNENLRPEAFRDSWDYIDRGEKIAGHEGNFTVNEKLAHTLEYTRDVGFCYMPYAVINGDLGRMFPPQPWTCREKEDGTRLGILPIIHVTRIFAYCDGVGDASLSVFQFNATEAAKDPRAIRAMIWLIASGWSNGFIRAPDLREMVEIMQSMGMVSDILRGENIHKIIQPWTCGHLYGGPKFKVAYDRRSRERVEALRGENPLQGSAADTVRFLDRISADLEKYAVVPRGDLKFNAERRTHLKYQGVDSRGQVVGAFQRRISLLEESP